MPQGGGGVVIFWKKMENLSVYFGKKIVCKFLTSTIPCVIIIAVYDGGGKNIPRLPNIKFVIKEKMRC